MIVVVDYGMGNLRSVLRKMERLKIPAVISGSENDIIDAKKLILPGVGNFEEGMKNLTQAKLISVLNHVVLEKKKPILGICLGMQLLTNFSEEGNVRGLEWVDAATTRFNFLEKNINLRIPHVGWNLIKPTIECPLLKNLDFSKRYYFTHSYFVKCNDEQDVVASTDYGIQFHSVINKKNIYGTQFHPEKSHFTGLQLIENFVNYCN